MLKIRNKLLASVAIPSFLFGMTLLIYGISYHGEGKNWNYFVLLADALLHGRLYLLNNPPWLSELITWQGRYYVPYQPMPAILLVPFVALFGVSFQQPYLSIGLGAANVLLAYIVCRKLFDQTIAIWLALLFGFGTIHWYHAEVGSVWYIAHIVAIFFIWLTILETLTKRRYLIIGLLIGAAFLSRLPALLAVAFPLIYRYEDFFRRTENRQWPYFLPRLQNWINLGVGIGCFVSFYALYNYVRFGTVTDAYRFIPNILNEPWSRYGLISIRYLPERLTDMLWSFPRLRDTVPYVIPNVYAMAIWVTTPAIILAFRAPFRHRLTIAAILTCLAMASISVVYSFTGFTQFGYRYALDYWPFLLILIGLGMRGRAVWYTKLLILLSIIINLWGVLCLSFYNIWSF